MQDPLALEIIKEISEDKPLLNTSQQKEKEDSSAFENPLNDQAQSRSQKEAHEEDNWSDSTASDLPIEDQQYQVGGCFSIMQSCMILPMQRVFARCTKKNIQAVDIVQDRFYCWVLAVLYSFVAMLLYADQNVLAPNQLNACIQRPRMFDMLNLKYLIYVGAPFWLHQIKKDFNFSDREGDAYLGGYINLAFFIIGIPAAILVGYLTPFTDRNRLLLIVVCIGQGPNLFAPLIKSYWQLFIIRFVTGISVGGTFPLGRTLEYTSLFISTKQVYSILGDLFPPKSRALVSILLAISLGGGTGIGQVIAGFIGSSKAGWRVPLVIFALPNILVALFVYLTQPDPPRGASEESLQDHFGSDRDFQYTSKMDRRKTWQVLAKPTNIFAVLQGLPGCLPWGVIIVYLADYLAQDQGLGIEKATILTMLFGIGGIVGCIGGGWLGQILYNRRKELVCIFIGISAICSSFPFYFLFNSNLKTMSFAFLNFLSFLGGIVSNIAGVNIRSILLNVNLPEARGLALALHTSLDDVGKGLGPFINALMIQKLGRKKSFNVSLVGWMVCGVFLMLCAFFVTRDEKKMHLDLVRNANNSMRLQARHEGDMELAPLPVQKSFRISEKGQKQQKVVYQQLEDQENHQENDT